MAAATLLIPSGRFEPNAARTCGPYAAWPSRTMRCESLVCRSDTASNRHSNDSVARSNTISMTNDLLGWTSRICHRKDSCPGSRVVPTSQRRTARRAGIARADHPSS